MRNNRPGSIQAAIQESYTAAGGLENVSRDVGISITTLSYGTKVDEDRPGGLGINYLDRLCRIEPKAAEALARHFAALAGGIYMPLGAGAGPLHGELSELMRDMSEVVAQHGAAHSAASADPGDYTLGEARDQIRWLDRLLSTGARFRGALVQKFPGALR